MSRVDPSRIRDLPQPALPWPIRAFNAWAERRPGGPRDPIEPAGILAAVDRALGGPAALPAEVTAALEILCRSLREDSNLHAYGTHYIRNLIVSGLVARARLERRFAAEPELLRQPLVPPLIVVGLQRSGTTLLHRLLCAADDARPLPLWESVSPVPPERGPDLRAATMAATFYAFRWAAPPALDALHYMRPGLPDECQFMLRLDLRSPVFWTPMASVAYGCWLFEQDLTETYQMYRRLLLLLQRGSPGKRLTLKNPTHALGLRALLQAVPEALVVQTHRDPLETLPSACLLTLTAQSAMTRGVDPAPVIDTVTRMQATMAQRSVEVRDTPEGRRIHEVDYRALVRDPVGTVQNVRAHFGMKTPPALVAQLQQHTRQNPQHGRGEYRYSIDQFGLSSAGLAETFAPYRARFGGWAEERQR